MAQVLRRSNLKNEAFQTGGFMNASSAPADFVALDACHVQIAAHLKRLVGLMDHYDRHGADAQAQTEAGEIEAFFSSTSRDHHREEEQRVFPALLTSADAELAAAVQVLQQDHGWIEEDWLELAPKLRAVHGGQADVDPAELRHAAQVFGDLCREHIELEESLVYPEAKARLQQAKRSGLLRQRQAAA